MPDTTHAPTPDEIRTIDDPTERFHAARAAEPLMKRELSEIARSVVADLHKSGMAGGAIASTLGISRQRVAQLLDPTVAAPGRIALIEAREAKLKNEAKRLRERKRKVAAAIEGA